MEEDEEELMQADQCFCPELQKDIWWLLQKMAWAYAYMCLCNGAQKIY